MDARNKDSLAFNALSIQPTARPFALTPGATPPPRSTGLEELADALEGLNPALRPLLMDAAAKANKDSAAAGELEAMRLDAEKGMEEIDGHFKQLIDEGKVPFWTRPAYREAYFKRAGARYGTLLEQRLNARLEQEPNPANANEAIQRMVTEEMGALSEKVAGADHFVQRGFAESTAIAIAAFQRQAADHYQKQFVQAADSAAADAGKNIAVALAHAPEHTLDGARENLVAFVKQQGSKERPKHEANGFVIANSIAPVLDDLISRNEFRAAHQLLDQVDSAVIDGGNGTLGATKEAARFLSPLRNRLEGAENTDMGRTARKLAAQVEEDRLKGQQAAMEAVSQARSSGTYNLAEETVSKLSAEFMAANKDASATTKEAFRKTVSETLRWDREGLREDSQIVQLEEQISDSVDPEQIGILADTAQSLMDAGRMSPSTFQAIQAKAKANTALLKEISKTDVSLADRSIFFYKDSESTIASVNLGSPQADEAWSKLPAGLQMQLRNEAREAYRQSMVASFRGFKSLTEALSVKDSKLHPDAVESTRAFVASRAQQLVKEGKVTEAAKKAEEQAVKAKRGRSLIPTLNSFVRGSTASEPSVAELHYSVKEKTAKGIKNPKTTSFAFVPLPAEDAQKVAEEQRGKDPAEWDVMDTPASFYVTLRNQADMKLPRVLDMRELAKTALQEPDTTETNAEAHPKRIAAARYYYWQAKARSGFTPEEVTSGKTKHGMTFDPAELQGKDLFIFGSPERLSKEWNGGDYTETFEALRLKVAPKKHPQDFFMDQMALRTSK